MSESFSLPPGCYLRPASAADMWAILMLELSLQRGTTANSSSSQQSMPEILL